MITGKGIGALAAALAIYFLARLTQVGWLYLVDAILWGALVLGLIMPFVGVAFITGRRTASSKDIHKTGGRLSEGDRVKITISLKNGMFYPRFFHSVKYDSPIVGPTGSEQRFFVAQLPGAGALPVESTVEAYQRGLHQLGPVRLESSVPFGFLRKKRTLVGEDPILVLPRVYPLHRLSLVDGLSGWASNARISRNGMDQSGSRPYVPGDSRRMVHWRNTARSGRLMVKEVEDQTNRMVHIMFSPGALLGYDRETNFEYAIKLVVSVADYALRNRVPVQIWGSNINGTTFAAPGSEADVAGIARSWKTLLETLAIAQPTEQDSISDGLINLPMGANLFVVLSADDKSGHTTLNRALAQAGDTIVVQLEDFGGPETGENLTSPLVQSGASVISCRPGGLEQTLATIENVSNTAEILGSEDAQSLSLAGDD